MTASKPHSKLTLSALVVGMLAMVAVALWLRVPTKERVVFQLRESAIQANESPDSHTVAKAWDWEHFSAAELRDASKVQRQAAARSKSGEKAARPVPFDVVSIYTALGNVELDEFGDVVVDHKARLALDASFQGQELNLGADGLAELQELIRIGLPGKAGEQTAEMMADYYGYRLAEEEFMEGYPPPEDPEAMRRQFEQVVALREAHLGLEVAEQLYALEHAQTRYTLDVMQIEADSSLSDEEKSQRREALGSKLPTELAASDNESSGAEALGKNQE